MDVVVSAMSLAILAPVFLAIAAAVASDGGRVFYVHQRVGRGGAGFGCLKFRTMSEDADARLAALLAADPVARAQWAASRKLRDDPRVTWLGRLLRTTSLDELPQLINVLRGEMSLVGPRPVVEQELTSFYRSAAAEYVALRPGITGLWQISGRSNTDYARRVALDVAYARHPSLRQDLRILLHTAVAVLRREGAH